MEMAFSKERLARYRQAFVGPVELADGKSGYGIYAWNSRVSAAFFHSLHVFEVVLRNAICEALEAQYGDKWPYSQGFRRSLSQAHEEELAAVAGDAEIDESDQLRTGTVIPQMSFFFWEGMLQKRYQKRLWDKHLTKVFPGLNSKVSVETNLEMLRDLVLHVRNFRNRIAHHEPIFFRNLASDKGVIQKVIRLRSVEADSWVKNYDVVNSLLAVKPF